MKNRVWLALAIIAPVFLLLFLAGPKAHAWMVFKSADNVTVAQSETVNSSMYLGGRNIDIAGTVNGDVYCGAMTLNISGTVKGDVICAAQTINISGTIEGSLRLAGQTLNLSGPVGRNVSLVGQTVNLDSRAVIAGDASVAGQNFNLSGSIGRDLVAAGANLDINGQVARDVQATIEQFNLGGSAKVGGSISYTSKNVINKTGGAQVSGTITQNQPKAKTTNNSLPSPLLFFGWFAVVVFVSLILTAVVIAAIVPRMVQSISQRGIDHPWLALGVGFVSGIVVFSAIILLMITVVGIPLAILVGLAWLLINLSSGVFSSFWLGRKIWRNQHNAILIMLAGSSLLLAIYLIPIVGIIALVIATWFGQGMILLELKARMSTPKKVKAQ